VIKSFKSAEAETLFNDEEVRKFVNIRQAARRKLLMRHAAKHLMDLSAPRGNRLHPLKGDREGQHSISINDQWRICFVWKEGDAHNVEIVDYH
jgi:toxin HigB-1